MSGNGPQCYGPANGKLQFVDQMMVQISNLPLDYIDSNTTALRCQGMHLIEDLSQVEPSLWAKDKLISACIASIFALPSVDHLQSQDGANVQELYNETVEAMEAMLKCLLSERPDTTELFQLLDPLFPWMSSRQAHERARAVNTCVFLLKCADTYAEFQISHGFPRLGLLIGQLCLRLNDPKTEIGQQAMKGIYYLYSLILHQKGTEMKTDTLNEEQHQFYQKILDTYDHTQPLQNITQIVTEFGYHLTSEQMTEFLAVALGCVKEGSKSTTAASHAITSVILEKYKPSLQKQVPEIVDRVYQQLGSIHHFSDRQIVMRIMSQLAHTYMVEVCHALLRCPFPFDRNTELKRILNSHPKLISETQNETNSVGNPAGPSPAETHSSFTAVWSEKLTAEMWCALSNSCSHYELNILVNVLLNQLQLSPKATGNYITPLAASSAFCKLLSMPKCSEVALTIYPRLLMSLLVQVHYSIRHKVVRNSGSQEEFEPVCYVVMALKTLLLAVRCHCECAMTKKEQGWDLLTSCEDHHRGVGLLARAILQSSYSFDLLRILYLLVPFLERGDEEHQITATAFFIELLCMPEARRLPDHYSLQRLKRGLMNENSVIRSLCIKGLVNMANWPGMEIKFLLPAMSKSLSGMDGKLFVETIAELEKILSGPEGADCVYNIILSLEELFSDERENVRASSIYLFGKMVKIARKSKRHVIKHQILENLVLLLLHLQEENSGVPKNCKYALEKSFQFLGWKPPKQIVSEKSWHKHEEILDEICQYLVRKQHGHLERFLCQGIFYTESELPAIKRASITFIGFLILHMDTMAETVDLVMIFQTLGSLMHSPDASVRTAAAHTHEHVSAVLSKQKKKVGGNSKETARGTTLEKPSQNDKGQHSLHSSCSNLFSLINFWKLSNRN